jgi:hypothetical protein
MKPLARHLRGFAIVSAIFILVVLAALGAFMVTISSSQQVGSALDVQGVRAYQAARAGIEWGLYRQLRDESCSSATSFSPAASSLSGFTVSVACTASVTCSVVAAGAFVIGTTYIIRTAGDTDFTLIGAANSNVNTIFTATGPGTGTGTAAVSCEPIVYRIVSTACSSVTCPNATPGNFYIERRLEVSF